MTDRPPVVTIGLPVYNGADFLEEAIDSIRSQTFQDFELIISDNASTDETEAICAHYVRIDPRISYYRSDSNQGAAWNYNRVFELGVGRYFKWAAHDDVLGREFLAQSVAVLEGNPDVVLCYARTVLIDETGAAMGVYPDEMSVTDPSPYRRWQAYMRRYFPRVDKCNPIFGVARRDVLEQTPLIGRYLSSDMVLLGELALWGKIRELDEGLFFRRDHPKMSVRANPNLENRAVWFDPANRDKVILRRWRWFREYFSVLSRVPLSAGDRVRSMTFFFRHYLRWSARPMYRELRTGARHVFNRKNGGERRPFQQSRPSPEVIG